MRRRERIGALVAFVGLARIAAVGGGLAGGGAGSAKMSGTNVPIGTIVPASPNEIPRPPTGNDSLIDARYAGLAARMPARGTIGYLCESGLETLEGQRRFAQASYSLAPRIFLPDDGESALVLADVESPARARQLAAELKLQVIELEPSGAALLARAAEPGPGAP